jgi:hypothetical protein
MNKSDFILISVVISIILLLLIPTLLLRENATKAYVYYDNKLIKEIDLSLDETREYKVNGYNGEVIIETKKSKIRVKKEVSPLHLCSRQGYISSSLETIVCLPNKIVIKIGSTDTQVDAIVR